MTKNPISARTIPPSELPLTSDHRMYHLHLHPEAVAEHVILVGDPARVTLVSQRFDAVLFQEQNREIKTCTGRVGNTPITVLSTGMGCDNLDIVVTELDACVNINLEQRTPNQHLRKLNLIRLGTSGSLHRDIPVNSFVASDYVIGIDGVLHFYAPDPSLRCFDIEEQFIRHTRWESPLAMPYSLQASPSLLSHIAHDCTHGITLTAAGFYGPQGREVRLPLARPDLNARLENFIAKGLPLANYEMETSALYALGQMLGHNTLTVCTIIANRTRGEFSNNHQPIIEKMIDQTIERIITLNNK